MRALLFFLLCVSGRVWCQPQYGALLGLEGRLEESVNGSSKEVFYFVNFGAQARWTNWRWQSELTYNSEATSEGSVSIQTQTYGWLNWAQYIFLLDRSFRPYLGAGLGLMLYKVKTSVDSGSRTVWSDVNFDLGVAAGVERTFWEKYLGAVELRMYKTEQKKDPILSGLFQISYQF